jgi:hypothetical protein
MSNKLDMRETDSTRSRQGTLAPSCDNINEDDEFFEQLGDYQFLRRILLRAAAACLRS